MEELGISPIQLAQRMPLPEDSIERGIRGEPKPVMHALTDLVDAFGLVTGRQESFEDTSDVLPLSELKVPLKARLGTPPHQGNLWDD